MNFASDNTAGVSQPILEAMLLANAGRQPSYGEDVWTQRAKAALCEVFEREVTVFLVPTGTAANAISLAGATPPWGAVLCHAESHANTDECGAPEFYAAGAKLVPLPGRGAKIDPDALADVLDGWAHGDVHRVQPACVTITQSTEYGLVYRPDEIAALGEAARRHGLALHMDGARFANAVVAGKASPADLTWRAGVDLLSFGATKNGAMAAEAIVVFRRELAESLAYRRKRAGHLFSKGRFLGAQIAAYLEGGHWLDLAAHANAMATRLANAFERAPGARLALPVEANEAFVWLGEAALDRLAAANIVCAPWAAGEGVVEPGRPGEALRRFVTSFATTSEEVEAVGQALAG